MSIKRWSSVVFLLLCAVFASAPAMAEGILSEGAWLSGTWEELDSVEGQGSFIKFRDGGRTYDFHYSEPDLINIKVIKIGENYHIGFDHDDGDSLVCWFRGLDEPVELELGGIDYTLDGSGNYHGDASARKAISLESENGSILTLTYRDSEVEVLSLKLVIKEDDVLTGKWAVTSASATRLHEVSYERVPYPSGVSRTVLNNPVEIAFELNERDGFPEIILNDGEPATIRFSLGLNNTPMEPEGEKQAKNTFIRKATGHFFRDDGPSRFAGWHNTDFQPGVEFRVEKDEKTGISKLEYKLSVDYWRESAGTLCLPIYTLILERPPISLTDIDENNRGGGCNAGGMFGLLSLVSLCALKYGSGKR